MRITCAFRSHTTARTLSLFFGLWSLQPAAAADLYFFSELAFSSASRDALKVTLALYRLDSGRLREVTISVEPPDPLDLIMPRSTMSDPEVSLVAITGSVETPPAFRFMSMDNPGHFQAREIQLPGYVYGAHVAEVPGRGRLLIFRLINVSGVRDGQPRTDRWRALDLATGRWEDASPEMYRYIRVVGGTQGYTLSQDQPWLKQLDSEQLVIIEAGGEIPIGPPLAASLQF